MPASLRIATLNICGLPTVLSRLAPFESRAAEIGRRLEASDVDVFNVQELWGRRSAAALRRHLPSFRHVAWRRAAHGGPAGGVATFSRHPLGKPRFRSFSGTVPRTDGLAFRAQRALNAQRQGVLTVPLTGSDVTIANTHLTANKDGDWSTGNRYYRFHRDQLDVLHEFLRGAPESGTPKSRAPTSGLTILTGDFNIASNSPLYPFVVEDGAWRDPFRDLDLVTYRPEFLPPEATPHRIDYILLAGDEARFPAGDAETLFADRFPSGEWPSDHIGLVTRIHLDSW